MAWKLPAMTEGVTKVTQAFIESLVKDAEESAGSGTNVQAYGLKGDGVTDNTALWNTLAASLPATGAEVYFPPGKYVGVFVVEGKNHLTIRGAGSSSVLHCATAGGDALKCVKCESLVVENLRVQTIAGARDGLHLEGCQSPRVVHVSCGGAQRAMMWAQKCAGILCDGLSLSVNSGPYPTGVQIPQSGLVLTWDGSDVTSGCNEFVISGGEYVVGQTLLSTANTTQYTPGWAIQCIRCEGGAMTGTIAELSPGGIYMQFCENISIAGNYSEFDPGAVTYETGTVEVTALGTAVVGTGTEWKNTVAAPEQANGFAGKYLIGPLTGTDMSFARIATLVDNTHVTLSAENELLVKGYSPGKSQSGIAYKMVGADLFLDQCKRIRVSAWLGTGILLRASSFCNFDDVTTECIFLTSTCQGNEGRISTNRVTTKTERVIDAGINNLFSVSSYQSGVTYQEKPLPSYTEAQRASLTGQRAGTFLYISDGAAGKKVQVYTGTEWVPG